VQRVGWRFLESVLHVPPLRLVVLRVHQEDSGSDLVSGRNTTPQYVLQKRATNAGTLVLGVDRESREKNRGHRARARLARERPGSRFVRPYFCRRESVVPDDGLLIVKGRDIDPCRVGSMCLSRVLLQPVIEGRFAAMELVEPVTLLERLGVPVGHEPLLGYEHAGAGEQPLQPIKSRFWSIEAVDELRPPLLVQREPGPVCEDVLSFDERSAHHEIRQRALRRVGCDTNQAVGVRTNAEIPSLFGLCCHARIVHTLYGNTRLREARATASAHDTFRPSQFGYGRPGLGLRTRRNLA